MANSKAAQEAGCCSVRNFCRILRPKPLTSENVFRWYIPAIGSVSYTMFSAHILNPSIMQRVCRLCSAADRNIVANYLFFNSHLGIGLYLYNSKHLSAASQYYRIIYSIYGALLFNFGSVLFWAVTKSILPHNSFIQTAYGIGSSVCLLYLGRKYIIHVDGWCQQQPSN